MTTQLVQSVRTAFNHSKGLSVSRKKNQKASKKDITDLSERKEWNHRMAQSMVPKDIDSQLEKYNGIECADIVECA